MKNPKMQRILGIETSCDETAVSLIEIDEERQTVEILGDTVHSQIDIHAAYGGVFPTLAKREHQRNIVPVLIKTLGNAAKGGAPITVPPLALSVLEREPELLEIFKKIVPTIGRPDIDRIAVTVGPGLEPALWVGINFARALSATWDVPIVPANHMEGHILVATIKKKTDSILHTLYSILSPAFPALSLLISGGHTQIVLIDRDAKRGALSYSIVGETLDDAVGECFDKTARTLGLAYPGGPKISALAAAARREGIESPEPLPRPMIGSDALDFSFSGLKTAVLYLVKRLAKGGQPLEERAIKGICREIEDAVTDVLIAKMRKAIERFGVSTLIIGGGVIANAHIREALERLADECSLAILLPQTDHSTDNALMIALAGYFNRNKAVGADVPLAANGTLALGPRA